MARARRVVTSKDPIEISMERAFAPGSFIRYNSVSSFIDGLERVVEMIDARSKTKPTDSVRLYDTFIAACHEKAEELDDSGGELGMFVEDLIGRWLAARDRAKKDSHETAALLIGRMTDDPYGFASGVERKAALVMNASSLAAFETHVLRLFDASEDHHRRQWAAVLRAIYARRKALDAYIRVCEATETTSSDCLAIATILRARRKLQVALEWTERGLALEKSSRVSIAEHELVKVKRALLKSLGRNDDALADAWSAFEAHPHVYAYRDLMTFVPKRERAKWHTKAMEVATSADAELGLLIDLWLETKELTRMIERLRSAKDAELEDVSHYQLERAASAVKKEHPDIAARAYRALGMHIVDEKLSRHYEAAIGHFAATRECYARACLEREWIKLVAMVRRNHHRKTGFMPGFERLVAGERVEQPSFLERARSRWNVRAE